MASSKNDIPKNITGKADTYEDEIDLIDYFRVVWKRKYFIVLGSALPALIVFLFIYFSPKDYKLTYLYDIGLTEKSYKTLLYDISLTEKNYKTLLDKFYSAENLGKLTAKLKENKLNGYWQEINESNVKLEVSPSYFSNNGAQATDVDNLQKIQKVTGTLLAMTITGRPRKDIEKISSIIRDNFEKVIPIYDTKQELNTTIIDLKTEMADIEERKFDLELELKRKKAISEKLKKMEPADSNETLDGIVYQECPVPAATGYGDGFYSPDYYEGVKVNNSGHLRVMVSPDSVRVDYVRSVLPEDEPLNEDGSSINNADISYSYTIRK